VGGAAGEHPGVQVPGRGALHRGGDTLPDTLHRHLTLYPSQPVIHKFPDVYQKANYLCFGFTKKIY